MPDAGIWLRHYLTPLTRSDEWEAKATGGRDLGRNETFERNVSNSPRLPPSELCVRYNDPRSTNDPYLRGRCDEISRANFNEKEL